MKVARLIFVTVCLGLTLFVTGQQTWPRKFTTQAGETLVLYEPQPESLENSLLKGRAAISIKSSETTEPVFGAISFSSKVILSGEQLVMQNFDINGAKVPGITEDAELEKYTGFLSDKISSLKLSFSKSDLEAAIKKEVGTEFANTPPAIIYTSKPTTLVVLDGDPEISKDADLDADKVVNSPYLIFKEGSQWNMYVGGNWYKSGSILDGWVANKSLSSKLRKIDTEIRKQESENNDGKAAAAKPTVTAIRVVTSPTELIQTNGEANYKSVANTSLLYAANSSNEIFKDLNTQKTFVLIAGRWYAANAIGGPWTYIASEELPADFAKIPAGSDKDAVRANVAGTEEAEEAMLDADVPQTAKVDRQTATIDVEYDGQPQFAPIAGTSLQLAENANVTVMIDPSGRYFALENGVWFIGSSPTGPWSVANERPRDIDNVPPSSPAYNSRYVYIYDIGPRYVYVGYTSGYTGGYRFRRTIIYGTGYRYRPWFRRHYYARPVTWGYGFAYNPWHGWSMNWGYNFGYLFIGFHPAGRPGFWGGWFGPPMYRPPYRPPYWRGGYYTTAHRPRPQVLPSRPGNGNRPGGGWSGNPNVYVHHKGVITKDIDRTPVTRPTRPVTPPVTTLPGTGRPGTTRPLPGGGANPGNGNKLPETGRPVTRPGAGNKLPVVERPGSGSRPGNKLPVIERPGSENKLPVTERPGTGNKLPVIERPGSGSRPGSGNKLPDVQRPSNPSTGRPNPSNDNRLPETNRPPTRLPANNTRLPVTPTPATRPARPAQTQPASGQPAGRSRQTPAPTPNNTQRPERKTPL